MGQWKNTPDLFFPEQKFENVVFKNFVSMENDVFPGLAEARDIRGVVCEGNFIDIGIPEDFHRAGTLLPQWIGN